MILNESKRDNLLLPYLQIMQERGINMSLGQFKTKMLQKLSNEGPLTNLSLDSNFYLAGAVRYYFNGDLTLNKDLSIFKPEGEQDQWNVEVGQYLNALIKILRNIHIDSVGTTMEQPEDFGVLSLPKLLRKYGAKIKKELGIVKDKDGKEAEESDGLDRNPNVGNGYTYEILYNHEQATKYNAATSPGAWCITYDTDTYYNMYIKRLDIHYVIFKQNGWENIDRTNGLDKSKWKGDKPQDPYGNSLIAVLQSNTDGRMVYITSRWNHGYSGDHTNCEADHAYTDQEFYDITGVTPDDMQRIFNIWKKDVHKQKRSSEDRASANESKQKLLRALKYIQMRINGGENPGNLVYVKECFNGDAEKLTKSLVAAYYVGDEGRAAFLMDKGKIIFDTIIYDSTHSWRCNGPINKEEGRMGLKDAIIWAIENGKWMVYNIRLHKLLDIDGINKFKSMPTTRWVNNDSSDPTFYEIKMANRKIAFVNYSNNLPLKLPNGQSWFYEYHVNSGYWRGTHSSSRGELNSGYKHFDNTTVVEILYDPASREKYFYSVQKHAFINVKDDVTIEQNGQITALEPVMNTNFRMDGYYSLGYQTTQQAANEWGRVDSNLYMLFTLNGEQVSIEGISEFSNLRGNNATKLIGCSSPKIHTINHTIGKESDTFVYDVINKQLLRDDHGPIPCEGIGLNDDNDRVVTIRAPYIYGWSARRDSEHPYSNEYYYLFDTATRQLIKNPIGWPSDFMFRLYTVEGENGDTIVYYINNEELTYPRPEGGWPFLRQLRLNNNAEYQQPAVQLAESEIYTMVAECVKRLLKHGNKRTNK